MTDPIETARADGIALGLEMAKAIADEIQAISDAVVGKTSTGPHSYRAGYDAGERAVLHHFAVELEAKAPIPPHVAAARVLLERGGPGIFGMFQDRALPTSWSEIDLLARDWLEQIAKDAAHA